MFNGNRLKQLRKEKGLTQQALGDSVHVTKVSICCYEKGTRTPNVDTLFDLADRLDVSIDYLLSREEFVVADNEATYSKRVSKEELIFLEELKKHRKTYEKVLEDPKRFSEIVINKTK